MFIDSHFHPYLAKKDVSDMLDNFKSSGGTTCVAIGVDPETSLKCIEYAKQYPEIKTSVGVHPSYVGFDGESLPFFLEILSKKTDLIEIVGALEEIYVKNKETVVAIGECGLDYHWIDDMAEKQSVSLEQLKLLQSYYFKAQILLAQKYNLPFIIHTRSAKEDTLKIIKEMGYKNFIVHCFSEDYAFAKSCLDFAPECFISFSGILTFKNAHGVHETAQKVPLENILVETDSPYLTPTPYRGKEENEPAFTKYVLDYLCDVRSENYSLVKETVYKNTCRVFGL